MADRPILFSASVVQALLREARQPGNGKTQTRRILNPWVVAVTFSIHARNIDQLAPIAEAAV